MKKYIFLFLFFPFSLFAQNFSGFRLPATSSSASLATLTDVNITGAASGNILMRRASGIWVDTTATTIQGGWTDTGTEIELLTTTDEVIIGGTASLSGAKVTIDGDANQIQLFIQENSSDTQNSDNIRVQKENGVAVFSLDGSGSFANGYFLDDVLFGAGDNSVFGQPQRTITVVEGGATVPTVQIRNDDDGGSVDDGLCIQTQQGTNAGSDIKNFENSDLRFWTNNNQRMNLKNNGDLIIEDADLIFSSGTTNNSSVSAGSNAFTTTATTDTVIVSGSANTDLYWIQLTGTGTPAATDAHKVEALSGSFVVHRGAAGTSGLTYNWKREKP
jgi:hypothetical protein